MDNLSLKDYSNNHTRRIKYSLNILDEIDSLPNIPRNIIEFDEFVLVEALDDLFAELIARKIYPLTSHVPLCCVEMRHASEFFSWSESNDKPKECGGCLFKNKCYYNPNFKIKPILDREQHKDALRFIENENTINWL